MASMRGAREGLARLSPRDVRRMAGIEDASRRPRCLCATYASAIGRHPLDNRVRELLVLPRRLHVAARRRQPERPGTAFYGGPDDAGGFDGLQTETARVPFAAFNLVKLPDDVS